VAAEHLAVVGGVDHDRIVADPKPVQLGEQAAELGVETLDEPVVMGQKQLGDLARVLVLDMGVFDTALTSLAPPAAKASKLGVRTSSPAPPQPRADARC
jgi:hypothetical protein